MTDYMQEMVNIYKNLVQQSKDGKKFSRVVCPHTYDTLMTKNKCRLCELCREVIFDRSKPKTDPIKGIAKRFSARKRYYSNMIFISNPGEILLFEYGDKIFTKLITLQADDLSEYKNFMHPTQGRNLYLSKIKIGPNPENVDYDIQPRVTVTPVPPAVNLEKLYDLETIIQPIVKGVIQPFSQAKLEFQKVEIRILPNGNPQRPLFFFKTIMWHDGISEEEFQLILDGKLNPITNYYSTQAAPEENVVTPTPMPVQNVSTETVSVNKGETSDIDFETEPLCFGQYDASNETCIKTCQNSGWGKACQTVHEQALARAMAAKLTHKRA